MLETPHSHPKSIHWRVQHRRTKLGSISSSFALGRGKAPSSPFSLEFTSTLSLCHPILPSFLDLCKLHACHHHLPDEKVKISPHRESQNLPGHS